MNPEPHHHITPVRTYVLVWIALIILTFVTTWVAEIDLGEWNIVVAMTIAVVKMSLVAAFFMHIKGASALTKLVCGAGLFWMAILFALTFGDYRSRAWLPLEGWW
ncbi:MAG TPA: cytochrome C oxidase subunit IV family protein [Bryobacteraceae bacterium]|jgi:cytochrome c oxidase subunit 4|nr:cytochrome C oxidase subunit IV family protein [Bryobacteraceae bacterium]